jgi:hypothetical protein
MNRASLVAHLREQVAHLPPEDADLYVTLYLERNTVSRGEAQIVANQARTSRDDARRYPPHVCPSVDRAHPQRG